MLRHNAGGQHSSIARALEIVGRWWTLLSARDALVRVVRFNDFRHRLGIAPNVLANRPNRPSREGVVERRPYREHPLRYGYHVTDKGRNFWPIVVAFQAWSDRYQAPDGPPVLLIHRGMAARSSNTGTARDAGLTSGPITRRKHVERAPPPCGGCQSLPDGCSRSWSAYTAAGGVHHGSRAEERSSG